MDMVVSHGLPDVGWHKKQIVILILREHIA